MLTPYLEQLIHEGKAEYKEFAIGGSGVGTIPVQTSEKVVIIDFTWNPFCDQFLLAETYTFNYFPIVLIEFESPEDPDDYHVGDTVQALDAGLSPIGLGRIISIDIVAGQMYVQIVSGDFSTIAQLNDLTTGVPFTFVSITTTLFTPVEGLLDLDSGQTATLITNTPFATDGFSPGQMVVSALSGPFADFHTFVGTTSGAIAIENGNPVAQLGINIPATVAAAIANSIHHLRFRSKGVEAIFNFRDIPTPILLNSAPTATVDVVGGTGGAGGDGGGGGGGGAGGSGAGGGGGGDALSPGTGGTGGAAATAGTGGTPNGLPGDDSADGGDGTNGDVSGGGNGGVGSPGGAGGDGGEGAVGEPGTEATAEVTVDVEQAFVGFELPDPIQIHTYILCQQTVQIDIWKFSPSGNVFNNAIVFGGSTPAKANEPDVPNGYANAVANPPILRIDTGQGAFIWNLGDSRQNIAGLPRNKDQFVDDIGDLTELNQPFNNESFPLVNIGYVLIRNEK